MMPQTDMATLQEVVFRAGGIFADAASAAQVHVKGPADFVTDVDLSVQRFLACKLPELLPGSQLMSEEKDNASIDFGGDVWILDPVDGTTNLIHNFCHSAVSLALVRGGVCVAGIVYNPFSREMFSAEKGGGAFLNGTRLHVSAAAHLSDALVAMGTTPAARAQADLYFARMRRVFDACHDIRRIGAASLELSYIAAGRLDGYCEDGLKPWDYAAGLLLLQEAGGTITALDGAPLGWTCQSGVAASNGAIHAELLKLL